MTTHTTGSLSLGTGEMRSWARKRKDRLGATSVRMIDLENEITDGTTGGRMMVGGDTMTEGEMSIEIGIETGKGMMIADLP